MNKDKKFILLGDALDKFTKVHSKYFEDEIVKWSYSIDVSSDFKRKILFQLMLEEVADNEKLTHSWYPKIKSRGISRIKLLLFKLVSELPYNNILYLYGKSPQKIIWEQLFFFHLPPYQFRIWSSDYNRIYHPVGSTCDSNNHFTLYDDVSFKRKIFKRKLSALKRAYKLYEFKHQWDLWKDNYITFKQLLKSVFK